MTPRFAAHAACEAHHRLVYTQCQRTAEAMASQRVQSHALQAELKIERESRALEIEAEWTHGVPRAVQQRADREPPTTCWPACGKGVGHSAGLHR